MAKKLKFIAKECVACEECTLICCLTHNNYSGLADGAIKITRNYPALVEPLFKASFCRQCKNAKCVAACPLGALVQGDDMVEFIEDNCTACENCLDACPFHAIYLKSDKRAVFKCDTCQGDPKCVKFCPHGALVWE